MTPLRDIYFSEEFVILTVNIRLGCYRNLFHGLHQWWRGDLQRYQFYRNSQCQMRYIVAKAIYRRLWINMQSILILSVWVFPFEGLWQYYPSCVWDPSHLKSSSLWWLRLFLSFHIASSHRLRLSVWWLWGSDMNEYGVCTVDSVSIRLVDAKPDCWSIPAVDFLFIIGRHIFKVENHPITT